MKVAIVEPAPIHHGWFHTHIETPHLGPPIIAGALKRQGHEAVVFSEFVQPFRLDRLRDFDVVGLSINTTLTHQRGFDICLGIRRAYPNLVIISGGHHITMNVDEALRYSDYVVRGYGETAFVDLIEELRLGRERPCTEGISYLDPNSGLRVDNPISRMSTNINLLPDLDSIDGFKKLISKGRWRLDRFGKHLPLSYFSRGCGFSCDFCSIPLADDPKMSFRDADVVIEDIKQQLAFYDFPYGKPSVWLIDDNFGQHRLPTKKFLKKLAEASLPCVFVVQARVEIANDKELLNLMKLANFRTIYLGVESISEESLTSMNKSSNLGKIEKAIEAINEAGINVCALIMIGSDGDRLGLARRTLQFLHEQRVRLIVPQITVPYPGTPFYRKVLSEGRIFSSDYRYCNLCPVHFPTSIRPSQVIRELIKLSEMHYNFARILSDILFYQNIQNFNTWLTSKQLKLKEFLKLRILDLEHLEAPFYDQHDRLITNKIDSFKRVQSLKETLISHKI